MANNHPDDLEELLDSALDDFQNINQTSAAQRNGDGGETKESSSLMAADVQGLGVGLPDLRIKKKGKLKVVKKESHVSEALGKLREQTREAVKGLESVTGAKPSGLNSEFGNDAMVEDWVKQFEELAGSQLIVWLLLSVPSSPCSSLTPNIQIEDDGALPGDTFDLLYLCSRGQSFLRLCNVIRPFV